MRGRSRIRRRACRNICRRAVCRLPAYNVEQITRRCHLQTFAVRCDVATLNLSASGSGLSRRRAEQQAAEEILRRIDRSRSQREQVSP